MAEVAEITIFKRELKSLDFLYRVLDKIDKRYGVTIRQSFLIDDWSYNNQRNVDIFSETELMVQLGEYRILLANFTIDENHKAGCFISKLSDEVYEIIFFLDTKNLPSIKDGTFINKSNAAYFNELTQIVTENIAHEDLIMGCIGIEIYIKYYKTKEDIIKNSSGVYRWVIPYGEELSEDFGLLKENNGDFITYTKIGKC